MYDIEDRAKLSSLEHDMRHFEKLREFGDPHNRLFYESQKLISPYHMPVMDRSQLHTDLMICVDEEFPYLYHSRKLVSKLRTIYNKENSWVFYKEYRQKSCTPDEKYANQISFLVNSLMFNN
jgi:hypothetical protein